MEVGLFCVRREEQEYRNALDHRRVEDVDAGVNVVADVLLRLLHETVNLTLLLTHPPQTNVFVRHDHSILGRVRNGLHLPSIAYSKHLPRWFLPFRGSYGTRSAS